MIFGCAGAAYGTAKSGIGIAGVGTFRPDLIMKVSPPFPYIPSRASADAEKSVYSALSPSSCPVSSQSTPSSSPS